MAALTASAYFPKLALTLSLMPDSSAFTDNPASLAVSRKVGYVENGSQYRDAIAFVLLIAILLIKPSGLFGKHVVEKV